MNRRVRVAFAMRSAELRDQLITASARKRIEALAESVEDQVLTEFTSPWAQSILAETTVLITGWGCPRIDAGVLRAAPELKLIAHAAGTVKGHVDPVCWERGVAVTTAAAANGAPVAEFTFAFILLAGKHTWGAAHQLRTLQTEFTQDSLPADIGNVGASVGIIGASLIGRRVLAMLRQTHLTPLVADPTIDAEAATQLGARLLPLDELMATSRVVSLHAPILPSTIGMIGARQLAAMPDGATFINTARGVLVDHDALRKEALSGRINIVLDVTDPEPLPHGDPLYGLPNVIITPHIAGSLGNELPLMGESAVTEVELFAAGQPLAHPITATTLRSMA